MLEFDLQFSQKQPKLVRISNSNENSQVEGNGDWDLDFELRPTGDLFADGICLHAVSIDSKSNSIRGSIMVRTFSYKSHVFIAIVDSGREIPGKFIRREFGTDFLEFHLELPKNADSIEFKVGLRVGRAVFWDDNDGKNYRVSKRTL